MEGCLFNTFAGRGNYCRARGRGAGGRRRGAGRRERGRGPWPPQMLPPIPWPHVMGHEEKTVNVSC